MGQLKEEIKILKEEIKTLKERIVLVTKFQINEKAYFFNKINGVLNITKLPVKEINITENGIYCLLGDNIFNVKLPINKIFKTREEAIAYLNLLKNKKFY